MRVFCVLVVIEGRRISPCRGLRHHRRDECRELLALSESIEGQGAGGGGGNEENEQTTRIFVCTDRDWGGKGREAKKGAQKTLVGRSIMHESTLQ